MNLAHDSKYDYHSDPTEWKSGDEEITYAQREYLSSLAEKAGEPIPDEELDSLTKAQASERIDELQQEAAS
jgi:hypothetical protein